MNNLHLVFSPYTLKLKKPFVTSRHDIRERNGFILKLYNEEGYEGIGDCCPLPEFGSEALHDVEENLLDFNLKINVNLDEIENSIIENLIKFDKLPALKHGVEQAILNLICNTKKIKIDTLLNLKLKNQIFVNGAIGLLSPDESRNEAVTLVKEGYGTIKVKAGRKDFDDDLSVIKSIRQSVGNNVKIRVDPNGIWNLKEAVQNLNKLEKYDIEYVEQPLKGSNGFLELSKLSNVAIVPDESVRSMKDAKRFIDSGTISFIILKPMLLGGLIPTLKIISMAEAKNITPVVTSSFESAVGRINAVIAAASIKSNVAHGLAVNNYFENDLVKDQFNVNSGKIILN